MNKIFNSQAPKVFFSKLALVALFFSLAFLPNVSFADNFGLGPKIISRSEWEANEKYMTWAPTYGEVKAFVIHHTAGEQKTQIDQKEAMRNLYYGHAVTYAWGDIGYNYVLDINGNVYEGREGGGSVVAGHTTGYNAGTIGIALIGDYTSRNMSDAQMESLTNFIAYESYQNNIDPADTTVLKGKNIPVIVGHKDLSATACPGDGIYVKLPEIRTKAAEKLKNYPAKTFSAQVISAGGSISIPGGDSAKAKISLKNTGNSFWLSQGAHKIDVKANASDFTAKIVDFGRSVEPGETGNLEVEIMAPFVNKSGNYSFELIRDGTTIPGSQFNLNVSITTPLYKAKVVGKSENQIIRPGKTATFWLEAKNMGANTWDGSEKIKLTEANGKDSLFANEKWTDKKTVGYLSPFNVSTGGITRYSFTVTAPATFSGQYQEKFILRSDNQNLEGGEGLFAEWIMVVGENETDLANIDKKTYSTNINDYNFQIVNQSASINMLPGETREMSLEVKNTGKSNWYSDIFRLATNRGQNRKSIFSNGTWIEGNRIEMSQYKVVPDSVAQFNFNITAPQNIGTYKEYFNFVAEGIGWMPDIGIYWDIKVSPPTYSAKITEKSADITTSASSPANIAIKIQNTGNITWKKNIIHLGTFNPYDRNSVFADSSWLSTNRLGFAEAEVKPNEIATFNFNLNTNQKDGVYRERFRLVAEEAGWFGKEITFVVTLKPTFDDFQYVNQSPFVSLSTGQGSQFWLEVKNTGTKIWQKSGTAPVRLATANPRDRVSPFINSNRILMDKDTVNPGEIVRFTFNVTAPREAKIYKEYFTLVRDGVAWFKDIGIYWQITVNNSSVSTPTPTPSPTPTNTSSVRVSATGPFIIVNGNDVKIAEGDVGDPIELGYKDSLYSLNLRGKSYISATQLRVVPWSDNTLFDITSYEDRPSWNQSLNDNRFKGVIEVRYSSVHKKLWIINELNIEDYLKGISESLNSFDPEYLKAASVAERSYVYYHYKNGGKHPDNFLTLKNSRKGNGDDQIYQGYGFTSRAANISAAVLSTQGEVVSYNNNPVITPYFNQSDGRTRSAKEVWGWDQTKYHYLVSVSDPGCSGLTLNGHGVGMSGAGARYLVSQGKKYKEVLNYYYTGTGVTKIDTKINVRVGIYSIDM